MCTVHNMTKHCIILYCENAHSRTHNIVLSTQKNHRCMHVLAGRKLNFYTPQSIHKHNTNANRYSNKKLAGKLVNSYLMYK